MSEEQQFYIDKEWQQAQTGVFWSEETPGWGALFATEEDKANQAVRRACTETPVALRRTQQSGVVDSVAYTVCETTPDPAVLGARLQDANRAPKGPLPRLSL